MNIIKELIPPALFRLLKNTAKEHKEYRNFEEALGSCTAGAYENIELCNMIAEKTVMYVKTLNKKPFILNPTSVFLLSAINQYLIRNSTRKFTVLDFGGASGAHYFEIRQFIPDDISLTWYVVETEQMVKSAINKGLNTNELQFVDSLAALKEKIDFVHSSGALQYVSNPYEFLDTLINLNPDWMFFNRMMFNQNNRDLITIQKSFLSSNGPGVLPDGYIDRIVSYPHITIAYDRFNKSITDTGYDLEWTFEESSGNFQIGSEKIIGRGLLYVKR